jgi:hypothetical protein
MSTAEQERRISRSPIPHQVQDFAMSRRASIWFSLAIVLCPFSASAQNADDAQIRTAIRRGVKFLKERQNRDGTWNYSGHELGITALAALALVENGVAPDDPMIKNSADFVRSAAASNTQTYDISLAILFLTRIGDKNDRDLIQELGTRLAAGQLVSGGWTYVCPLLAAPAPVGGSVTNRPKGKTDPARRAGQINAARGARAGIGDNSNTQFAVLGIWAAGRAGLDVKGTMIEVDRRFRGSQSTGGGWGYSGTGDTDAMTCAGLMSLVLAKGQKVLEGHMVNRRPDTDKPEGPGGRPKMDSDTQIDRGIQRVEFYANSISPNSSLYFLWSVERVAVALGLSRIGHVDWYNRGASVLLQTQQAEGAWRSGRGPGPSEISDTAFALLFLRRSNLTEGMPQLVTSRSGGDSSENKMRAGKLDDLIRSVKSPDGGDK